MSIKITKEFIRVNFPNLVGIPLKRLIISSLTTYNIICDNKVVDYNLIGNIIQEKIEENNKVTEMFNLIKQEPIKEQNPKQEMQIPLGQYGELMVRKWCTELFPLLSINCEMKSYFTDIILDNKIAIEVKNYKSRSIPTKEVDKFIRDMNIVPFKCGLFVSLSSRISKMPDGFHLQFGDGGKILLYISNSEKSHFKIGILFLLQILSVLHSNIDDLTKTSKIKEYCRITFENINTLKVNIKKTMNSVEGMNKTVDGMYNNLVKYLE